MGLFLVLFEIFHVTGDFLNQIRFCFFLRAEMLSLRSRALVSLYVTKTLKD
jgi:hypothetical protein